MKGGILMILIISTTITIIMNEVGAGRRAEREDVDSEVEEPGEHATCAHIAPASSASLGHTFRDMPTLFEHVMGLLQRDVSVLEHNTQMDKREANTRRTRDPASEALDQDRLMRRVTKNTKKARSDRSAPTPENLERLLDQVERKLNKDNNASRHLKREIKKTKTEGGRKYGTVKRKAVDKRNENAKSRKTDRRHDDKKYKRTDSNNNEENEVEHNDQDKRIVKRSAEDDDVGDSDRDLVKEQAGGTQAPPSADDNSDQARAESGGGGQQMVMGTFQAMMMPMQGAGQAISGLMSSG